MIGNILIKIKSWLIFFRYPLLSGLLIGTSYIPFPPWASLFAFVPLWYFWWENPQPRLAFWGGWVSSFVLTFIGFYWVAHTVHEFGHFPWILALPVLFIFCAIGNLHFALAGFLWAQLAQTSQKRNGPISRWALLLLLPIVTILCEHYFPMIFAWNFGYTWFYSQLPLFQVAEWIGFSGLSAWVIFSNLAFFSAWTRFKNTGKMGWIPICLAMSVFLVLNLLGFYLHRRLPPPDHEVGILAVQANIGNLEKQYAEKGWGFRDHIINRYSRLTLDGLHTHPRQLIDFALWPETAFPEQIEPLAMNTRYTNRLTHFLQDNSLALVTGAYSEDSIQGKPTNSLFSFTPQGTLENPPYHKTLLLAFGEYIPFGDYFPQLKQTLSMIADFARGPGPSLLTQNHLKLGAQICYEGLFPDFSKGLADQGAQILVNVTNDSWYGKSSQPFQHMYMTLSRAIEFRLPLIRSTNTGFTTAITAEGKILERSPLHQEWTHLYRLPYRQNPNPTFFQETGIFLVPALIWGLFLISIGGIFYRVNTRKS